MTSSICLIYGIRTIAPEENCPQLGLGFGSRLRLVLGLGGNQTIAPKENWPPVRVWVRVSFGVEGGQFSSGAIVLEPLSTRYWLSLPWSHLCFLCSILTKNIFLAYRSAPFCLQKLLLASQLHLRAGNI